MTSPTPSLSPEVDQAKAACLRAVLEAMQPWIGRLCPTCLAHVMTSAAAMVLADLYGESAPELARADAARFGENLPGMTEDRLAETAPPTIN